MNACGAPRSPSGTPGAIVAATNAGERVRDERVPVAHAEREERHSDEQPRRSGRGELALQVRRRRLAPRDERPDAGQPEQQQPERDVHRVEERADRP